MHAQIAKGILIFVILVKYTTQQVCNTLATMTDHDIVQKHIAHCKQPYLANSDDYNQILQYKHI